MPGRRGDGLRADLRYDRERGCAFGGYTGSGSADGDVVRSKRSRAWARRKDEEKAREAERLLKSEPLRSNYDATMDLIRDGMLKRAFADAVFPSLVYGKKK